MRVLEIYFRVSQLLLSIIFAAVYNVQFVTLNGLGVIVNVSIP